MMREFDRLAHENFQSLAPGLKDSDAPGKAIVFAITKNHATRLARILNDLHPEACGQYAEVITSDVADPDALIRKFKREAYPRVAVSVGMLDTGFDCREVLHLVLCRRVRSPILYQQIRGRGTRTAPHIGKKGFVIYDFFRNHEYFGDSDDHPFTGSGVGSGNGGERPGPGGADLVELDLDEAEQAALADRLNDQENYFNEDTLRLAYRTRTGTIIDFIRAALGVTRVKSREEQIDDNFRAWLVAHRFTPEQAELLTLLKSRGLANGKADVADLFQPPLDHFNAPELATQLFGPQIKEVVEELNTAVFDASA